MTDRPFEFAGFPSMADAPRRQALPINKYGLMESDHYADFEQALAEFADATVLDLGCGPFGVIDGDQNPIANKAGLVGKLIAVDYREDVAKSFTSPGVPENVEFRQEDVRHLGLDDSSVDATLLIGIYGDCMPYHQRDAPDLQAYQQAFRDSQSQLLKEAYRVTKPGGALIATLSKAGDQHKTHMIGDYFNETATHIGTHRVLYVAKSLK